MNPILRLVVAVLAGLFAFAVSALAVTTLFDPRIEFSLFVGLPVGAWVGLATGFVVLARLWVRDRSSTDPPSRRLEAVRWAVFAVAADVVLVFALGVGVYFLLGSSVGLSLLIVGIPVTMVAAGLVGYLAAGLFGDDGNGTSPAAQ